MAVYGYVRVSTTRQAEEGESLEVQQRQIEGYALMHGMGVDRVFVECGVSGSQASRPIARRSRRVGRVAGGRYGHHAEAGPHVPLRARRPGGARAAESAWGAPPHARSRRRRYWQWYFQLVFTILSAVAEAERDRIRERVATVKADQRQRGRYLGGIVPFGWRVAGKDEAEGDGRMVEVPEQQAAIQRMRALRASGASRAPSPWRWCSRDTSCHTKRCAQC